MQVLSIFLIVLIALVSHPTFARKSLQQAIEEVELENRMEWVSKNDSVVSWKRPESFNNCKEIKKHLGPSIKSV